MNKYCISCGGSYSEGTKFCPHCGMQIMQNNDQSNFEQATKNNFNEFEQQVANTYEKPQPQKIVTPQYKPPIKKYNNPQKTSKTKYILATIGVIAIVGMLIAIVLFYPFNLSRNDNNLQVMTTGPKVSMQSIANGNTLVVPEVGFTGVYGYYFGGTKVGDISFTSQGYEYYDGEQCIKVTGNGYFGITVADQEITINYDYEAYVANYDESLKYLELTTSYMGMDILLTMEYNEEAGEITATYTYDGYDGEDTTTVMKMSEGYWDLNDAFLNLYVGYVKEFSYTVDSFGYETTVSLKLTVSGKSDIVVPAGKYEDCYVVEIGQGSEEYLSTSTMWVTEDGVVPKMEVISTTTGLDLDMTFVLQLESYYEG